MELDTLQSTDRSAETPHLSVTCQSVMEEEDGMERLLGDVHVSIFRFSLNVSVMWRRQPRKRRPSLVSCSRSLLSVWMMLQCLSIHFLVTPTYSVSRGSLEPFPAVTGQQRTSNQSSFCSVPGD